MTAVLRTALLVVAAAGVASAHVGDRLFPVYEIPTSLLPDVHDGSLEDWQAFAPAPSMDVFDFFSHPDAGKADPIDLDDLAYQIFLGWHGPTGRLYFAMERLDDVYINDYGGGDPYGVWRHDGMEFMVDGDHSGGMYADFASMASRLTASQAQQYVALPESPDGQLLWLIQGTPSRSLEPERAWTRRPPWADAGGNVTHGAPTQSIFEFYLTPFDDLNALAQDLSVPSQLWAGKVIGVAVAVQDFDSTPGEFDAFHFLHLLNYTWRDAGVFVDAELIGCDLPDCGEGRQIESAVRANSWGRIKASLSD